MLNLLTRLFGSRNDRIVKGYEATVRKANALESALQALSDEALRAKTDEFRERLRKGEALNDLAPEAFAPYLDAFRLGFLVPVGVIALGVVGLLVARHRTRRRMFELEGIQIAPLWVALFRSRRRRGPSAAGR